MKNNNEILKNTVLQTEKSDVLRIDTALLPIVPLIQVAWAHGIVSAREKRLIFEAAREDGVDERDPLNDTLNEWLVYQPSRRFFNDCLERLSEMFSEMTVKEREREKTKLLSRCTKVAGVAGDERLDTDAYISSEELQSLAEIMNIISYRAPKPMTALNRV